MEWGMLLAGLLAVLVITGVYLPNTSWFARYDTGGAPAPVAMDPVDPPTIDPTEAALNQLGFSMSNQVAISVK